MATKKPAAKKQTVRRASAASARKTKVSRVAKAAPMRSFRVSPRQEPFFTFRVNRETFYWLVLAVVIVGFASWIISIDIKVRKVYDEIDSQTRQTNQPPYIKGL